MFERRLKIFLLILVIATIALAVRSAQVQVVERAKWEEAAAHTMRRSQLLSTTRGRIVDVRGRELAADTACTDACVDYRAITTAPDETWVRERALERVKAQMGAAYAEQSRSQRRQLLDAESQSVKEDLQVMWSELARAGGMTPQQMNDLRQSIVQRVETRKRLVEYRNWQRAVERHESSQDEEPAWRRFLLGEGGPPNREQFRVTVAEETESHVVLSGIDQNTKNILGKNLERFPGLLLRPSVIRVYPYRNVAAHLMGRVGNVNAEDLLHDPDSEDETRAYLPNDLIGRGGIEGLAERALRGRKGRVERIIGEKKIADASDPAPGRDVHITIDIQLQARIETAFSGVDLYDSDGKLVEQGALFHGACVLLDVPTGEVRALASYPTFDANQFQEKYHDLLNDPINQPLLNRATMSQLQPGSTIKPVVGLAAITDGLLTPEQGIECSGFLMLDGRKWGVGRCWVASKFTEALGGAVAHHPVPWAAPHRGKYGNANGWLCLADALERSCNVYFETLADWLGMEHLSVWYERFGLGRQTGIGIPEARGRLPRDYKGPASGRRAKTWFAGIGQDPVTATPLQMANVAATIARYGVWMRPKLISDAESARLGLGGPKPGDRVDLQLSQRAVLAAREGMQNVVSGPAGTGKGVKHGDALRNLSICAKTGTAQAPKFGIRLKDKDGKPVLDERGKPQFLFLEPSTPLNPNPLAPWYRGGGKEGTELNHAWYIGFAPAENPQIAFAVMVEYGGSGGYAAAAIAREALKACVEMGYVTPGAAANAGAR